MAKVDYLLPCSSFFSSGYTAAGCLALGMQATVIFWPAAAKWAMEFNDKRNVDKMLAEFSEKYQVPAPNLQTYKKSFRPAVSFSQRLEGLGA